MYTETIEPGTAAALFIIVVIAWVAVCVTQRKRKPRTSCPTNPQIGF